MHTKHINSICCVLYRVYIRIYAVYRYLERDYTFCISSHCLYLWVCCGKRENVEFVLQDMVCVCCVCVCVYRASGKEGKDTYVTDV